MGGGLEKHLWSTYQVAFLGTTFILLIMSHAKLDGSFKLSYYNTFPKEHFFVN